MEISEIIGIAVLSLLIIVIGIIFYMENRVRYYKNYLRYRMYSIDIRDVEPSAIHYGKIELTDEELELNAGGDMGKSEKKK